MKFSPMKIVASALALLLLAAGAVAQTTPQSHRGRGAMFGEPMFGFFIHQLDLTSDQQAQVKQILTKERPTIQPLMQQMAQAHFQLTQMALNGTPEETQVNTLASQQAQTMSALFVQQARIESELIQVLNPDQKTKLTQLLNERAQRLLNHSSAATPNQ